MPMDLVTQNEKLQILQTEIQRFAQKEIAPIADQLDRENRFPKALWPLLGKAGYLGVTIGKKYGGTELGYVAQAIIVAEISRASGGIGLSYGAHANLCANQIFRFGTEKQKETYLPKLNRGEWIGALAMSEKNAGSDVLNMQLQAEEKEDHFILNGHKMWITNGPDADIIIVYAKTNPEENAHGMTCFIVEKSFSGFSANAPLDKLGMRSSSTSELLFTHCLVPKENMLGQVNQGLKILMDGLDIERTILAAGPLGLMQACLDLMLPYVKSRKQFQKPIGEFQMIQQKIADAYTYFQAAKAYTYAMAALCDQNKITTEQAASVYLFVAENATKIALDTIQCLGGIGYLNDSPAGRLLRDAKLYEIGAGTTEIRRLIIARELMREK
ncbi:MAG: acyl-CoA dehydrogenase [Gammaproteobacteria bacterium CG_4_10_14_0_8_um_filter_38_16]|nr:MAG: acyl-CoA dehydrogenase [Gammaproteobacteria bacterium CG_4_10_14_0_8_um_filter_38_16]PJA03043.1 MAG: acyl-CoA dehydrogenase [Gammaproteobacteria bacterium CG_4_10_14_0_2_um_filter_38_22]PJB10227.1 MAG: acyl-CoA dehydrogenase [Gammaproteobacteria bacterium CG_4_9_14_3_um_filter_38_9]